MTTLPPSRPVVVRVDDSDGSRAALASLAEEARQGNAPLRPLHALSRPWGGTAATDAVVREALLRERTAGALVPVALTAQLLVVGHRLPLARPGSTTHPRSRAEAAGALG